MKAKLVIENIKFERGIGPVRGLDIGRYKEIRKDFEKHGVDIDSVRDKLAILASYIDKDGDRLRPTKNLFKVINHYRKDLYHIDKVDFVRDWIYDIARNNWKAPSREEFMEKAFQYTETVDYQAFTLADTIKGLYHAIQSDLEIFME